MLPARAAPSLAGIAEWVELAGRLANSPGNLIRWVQASQAIDPQGGMPDMDFSDKQARDIAAYLYTLRGARPDK